MHLKALRMHSAVSSESIRHMCCKCVNIKRKNRRLHVPTLTYQFINAPVQIRDKKILDLSPDSVLEIFHHS